MDNFKDEARDGHDGITMTDNVIELKCSSKHVFHTKCLKAWAKKKEICPMCRYPIL